MPESFHLPPFRVNVLQISGFGQIHENFVVIAPDLVNPLVNGDMQHPAAVHQVVQGNADQDGAFAEPMTGYYNPDIAAAKTAVNGLFQKPQRAAFIQIFAMHGVSSTNLLLFFILIQAGSVFLDQFL